MHKNADAFGSRERPCKAFIQTYIQFDSNGEHCHHLLIGTLLVWCYRQMKKDKKYFLDKLSCGISRMKRDDSVEQLRGPKGTGTNAMPTVGGRNSPVTYHEMIPGTPETSENKIPETSDTNHQRIPATSDAFENKMPGSPEDDDCFSLELVRTRKWLQSIFLFFFFLLCNSSYL